MEKQAKPKQDPVLLWAKKSASNERLKAMINLAKPDVARKPEDLDQDPWLFNCLNGTLELQSGKFREHRREDLITRTAAVNFDPQATAPTWTNFLDQIFDGKQDIINYVQRFVGYTLTGTIKEQCLAFLHGEGANGKTTFVNAVRGIFGDYAQEAAPDILLEKPFSGIPNDIARLRGARYVTVSETADGRRLDEATVKRLTGGDRITARYMRAEFFEFDPSHKLWLCSNHKPIIKGQDYAIWRRIRLIPFEMTFAPAQQDPQLSAKLHAEAPGILAWALRGCLDWQQGGLAEPSEVMSATAGYKDEMDVVQRFIDECCTLNPGAEIMAKDLYAAYKAWSERSGDRPLTSPGFGRRLTDKGFNNKHTNKGSARFGLSLVW